MVEVSSSANIHSRMTKPKGMLPSVVLICLLIGSLVCTLLSFPVTYEYYFGRTSSTSLTNAALFESPSCFCNCSQSSADFQKKGDGEIEKPCKPPPPIDIKPNIIKYHPWWAQGRTWHYPLKFPRCSLDACFNFSRCADMNDLKMFIYNEHNQPVRYFTNFNQTKWYTKDPDQACIFLVFLDTQNPQKRPQDLQHWNNGLNHALVTFADKWSQRMVAEDSIGLASLIVSEAHETLFRPGFDISIPLPAINHFREFQSSPPFSRKYLITFKGLRYLAIGEGRLRSYDSFRNIHNGEDVIVVTSCKHASNDFHRKENASLGLHCDDDDKLYSQYSYVDLMNTTFALVPAGIQPNSYRFAEVLEAGVIPILVVDNYVKPFDNLVTWYRCILQFPSSEMHRIVPAVRSISKAQIQRRQQACLRIYHNHFEDDSKLLTSTVAALEERFLGAFPSFSSHLFDLYD